jgi:hypothetical protein
VVAREFELPVVLKEWLAFGQPFLERLFTLARRVSPQQVLDADVLIQIGPMDALALSY